MDLDKIRTLLKDALDANEVAEVALTEINHLVATGGETEAPAASKKKGRRKKKGNGKAAPEHSIEDVKEVVGRVVEEFGNRGAEECLEPFGVTLIRDLTADQYGDVIKAAEDYLVD